MTYQNEYRSLADTDADGKMDINEFSIACKLINLKLRGFDIPSVTPPALMASLKVQSPPSMAPAPPRPEPPKMQQSLPTQPLIQSNISQAAPIMPNLTGTIPTGIVPPLQSNIPPIQPPLLSNVPQMTQFQNNVSNVSSVSSLIGGIPQMPPTGAPAPPVQGAYVQPIVPGTASATILPSMPMNVVPPMALGGGSIITSNVAPTIQSAPPIQSAVIASNVSQMSPVGSVTGSITGSLTGIPTANTGSVPVSTSTPRASITSISSLDRTMDM